MDDIAVSVAQNLDFNMLWLFQIFFNKDGAVAKGLGSLTHGRVVFL